MIAGIFKRRPSDLNLSETADVVLKTLNQFGMEDKTGFWADDSALLCTTLRRNTPESKLEQLPFVSEADGNILAFWGRLTNREELAETLGIRQDLSRITDTDLLYRCFLKWGRDLSAHVYGDFSFVLYDSRKKKLLCGVDHMSVKPLYYYLDDKLFIFASTLTVFHRLNLVPVNPDMRWAARYLLYLSPDFETTAYANLFKLPPAHTLLVGEKSEDKRRYFAFDGEQHLSGVSLEQCVETYREHLHNAVKARIRTDYPLGSENSGGLDSASVTALAALYNDRGLEDFYTFAFATFSEEPDAILRTCQKFKLHNNYICCEYRHEREDQIRSLNALGYPYEHGNSTGHAPFYKICQQNNVRTLLSGFGGDEFVTTLHARLAITELITQKKYLTAYRLTPGNQFTALLRLFKQVRSASGRKQEYCARLLATVKRGWSLQFLRSEIVNAYELKNAYYETARYDAGYTNLNRFTLEKRYLPHVPTRMNNCTLMAGSFGIDYEWPLLDTRLIACFLAIPTEYKAGKIQRYLHRKAVDGILPDEVNWKSSKSMGKHLAAPTDAPRHRLNEDLHPDLQLFINTQTVRKQLAEINDAEFRSNAFYPRSIKAINMVDLWLKMYFPQGANWQNTDGTGTE